MPAWTRALSRRIRGAPRIVWHAEYRLPLTSIAARTGLDPRRPELVVDALVELGVIAESDLLSPESVTWADLARVHTPEWVEALTQPETLASVFAVDAWDIPGDALLDSLRRICGGTLLAARRALEDRAPVLNLSGGFHHAAPGSGGGFCAVNDIAVAIAALRETGFTGRVVVLDLDAHPPDGLAACVDATVWIGSLSGTVWEAPPHVDEVHVPHDGRDDAYLTALDPLLQRMPRAALTFVLAGGDVRAGDPLGGLRLTEVGVRHRDQRVLDRLAGSASVWLPGGGYRPDAWRVLTGTALVLAGHGRLELRPDFDPMRARFRRVGRGLSDAFGGVDLDAEDVDSLLGPRRRDEAPRFLDRYTRAAVELALERYGLAEPVRRLGYRDLRAEIDRAELGDRFRLYGTAAGTEHLLAESVLARGTVGESPVLFVHWLTLRHPLGAFRSGGAPFPGQEVPGLGLAREAGELHRRIAERLGLAGVAMRPAWLHVAYAVRDRMRFVDPEEQRRFEAVLAQAAGVPLPKLSALAHEGKVLLDGQPWRWPAALMVEWLTLPSPA